MFGQLRFHGRGGEGVKLAARIVSRAAFEKGCHVQDSPLYGAERRGAPVAASVRVADRPVRDRGYIERPDLIALLDPSLLELPEAGVLAGAQEGTAVLVNSSLAASELRQRHPVGGEWRALDLSAVALRHLGQHVLSAPMAAFVLGATRLAPWEAVEEAMTRELAAVGVGAAPLTANLAAAREVFDAVLPLPEPQPRPGRAVVPAADFRVPRIPGGAGMPRITAAATTVQKSTAAWRVFRPEIDLSRCTRCWLCFVLCPEGAIDLDPQGFPVIDDAHCKGCLVCAHECPPEAIRRVREEAA